MFQFAMGDRHPFADTGAAEALALLQNPNDLVAIQFSFDPQHSVRQLCQHLIFGGCFEVGGNSGGIEQV